MFSLKKKISLAWVGLLLSMPLCMSPAQADDMEIYNMTTDTEAAGDVNIIFMLDNSGSMKWCIDSTSSSNCSDAAKTRMFALRKAMDAVLQELEDTTKVAIFTYGRKNDDIDGGSILAPLRALGDTLPDGVTTHRQYLTNWFVDSTKTGDDRYKIANAPANWAYNFGPKSNSSLYSDPPNCTSTSGAGCSQNWNDQESNLNPQNNTPLESAYAEIGAYLLGQKASSWGNTYFARSGRLAKMTTVSSGWDTYWSKLDSTLSVTTTTPLTLSGSEYFYRQPDYTVQQTCAAPSWHVILVTDGEPTNDDNRAMFKQVMGTQSTCSTSTTWSCSKEMALFLANKSVEISEYSWECTGNCEDYIDSDGDSAAPSAPTNMGSCNETSEAGNTTTSTVSNYKGYNWSCQSTPTTNYSWTQTGSCNSSSQVSYVSCDSSLVGQNKCMNPPGNAYPRAIYTCQSSTSNTIGWACTSGENGGSCSDSNKPTPSSWDCNSAGEIGHTETTWGNATNRSVTWQCDVDTDSVVYDNGLDVKVKTDAIFVGPDASTTAKQEMTNITNNGDGIFNNSTSVDALINALLATIAVAEKEPNTVSAPGVAVNQLSRFQHLDQLYYSVFQPAATGLWEGNLKRFLLKDSKVKDSQEEDAVDSSTKFFKLSADSCWGIAGSSTEQPAGCTGYTVNDGKDSTLGGMRSKLDIDNRNILTTTDGSSVVTLESLRLADSATSTTTTTSAGYLGYSSACASSTAPYCNGALTALGADNAAQIASFNQLIDWGKGERATGNFSMLASDPLHSQPVLVNYGFEGDSGSGATRQTAFDEALADGAKQENYVFFSTNGGVLHGVDANTGVEKFAFIPKEMLPLIPKTKNVPTWTGAASRTYGLDSTWVAWRRDANVDGDIKDSNEWAYLYGGMRMGGSNYYALDVTDIDSPTIEWTINGPLAGGFLTTTDSSSRTVYRPITVASVPSGAYRWMGQTWSKPVLARIALKSGTADETGRTVLVFGGGYDPTNETQPYLSGTTTVTPASTFGTDAYGHQLYIVDAKTGDLLFWAAGGSATYGTGTTTSVTESPTLTVTDMKYSITGSPTPVDRDGDGYTDLIYFADLGGQVFRLDLKNKGTNNGTGTTCTSSISSTCSDMVLRVAKIASLGEADTASSIADQRRFFEAPGVGILQRPGGTRYMGVAIGSGNRSHPAYIGTQDRIYVFEDSTALTANLGSVGTIAALTHTNLEDVTEYDYDAVDLATFTGKQGFYIDVTETSGTGADGEKIFSTPLIFQGLVYLTSYIPETGVSTSSNQCSPGTGSSSLYIFNVFDGRAQTTDAEDLLDRTVEGITSTITGDVQIVFNSDGTSTILAGTYAEEAGASNKGLRRTRWYENPHY